jgi:hypothetical protein
MKVGKPVPAFTEPAGTSTPVGTGTVRGIANLLSLQYSVRNGPVKRADRLDVNEFIVVDNIVWQITDGGFKDDGVELRLLAHGDFSMTNRIICPRWKEFKTIQVVVQAN